MDLKSWLRGTKPQSKESVPARWLQANENPWGLLVLDCAKNAQSMMSATKSREIALKYTELRHASGQELPGVAVQLTQSVPCELTYEIKNRPAYGPVFKSSVMEEKWDIYWYDERLFFCRSWRGELVYRAATKCEPSTLKVLMVESAQETSGNMAIRQVDFLIKSHVMSATALHPLPQELSHDVEKLALYSFNQYGRKGLYGTFEETIGTAYHWNQSPPSSG